jgi:hypothetical protein
MKNHSRNPWRKSIQEMHEKSMKKLFKESMRKSMRNP